MELLSNQFAIFSFKTVAPVIIAFVDLEHGLDTYCRT